MLWVNSIYIIARPKPFFNAILRYLLHRCRSRLACPPVHSKPTAFSKTPKNNAAAVFCSVAVKLWGIHLIFILPVTVRSKVPHILYVLTGYRLRLAYAGAM